MKEILYYTTTEGKCPYKDWFNSLDVQMQTRISSRIERLIAGHYGETRKLVNSELSELKFKFGKGYRIYYKDLDNVIVLFVTAGDKSSQKNDIKQAEKYYDDFIERLKDNG